MKVVTLTYKDVVNKVEKLIFTIDFQPEVIIGVMNGAKFMIEQFKQSEKFNTSYFIETKLQRETEKVKKKRIVRAILKTLPYTLLNRLRIIESKKVQSKIKNIDLVTLNNLSLTIENLPSIELKNILIIDDAVDSGKTLYIIQNQLMKKYPKAKIKSAVIAWTIIESIVQPDYYLFKDTLVRYPWSKDFKS